MPVTRFPLPPTTPPHTPSTAPPSAPPGKAHLAHETARAVLKENPLPHRQPMAGTSFPARGNFYPSHHALTPRLRATCPSFVTRYRPPAPTHCTHPSPINRRNNRLKFFPLAPNGSPPQPLNLIHQPTLLLRQPRYRNQRTNRK